MVFCRSDEKLKTLSWINRRQGAVLEIPKGQNSGDLRDASRRGEA